MGKKIKLIGCLIFGILILFGLTCLILTSCGKTKLLSKEPLRLAKLEIPVTYQIGWWSNQEGLIIDSLKVQIVESNLNLFNSKSFISYKVSGRIEYKNHWKPYISKIHISERLNRDSTLNYNRIIEITPIVKTKQDTKKKGGIVEFEFENEHKITSGQWGINQIIIRCQNQEELIEFRQIK